MKRNYWIVALILLVFFVISFLTNIIGPLIPEIIRDFHVSLTMAALLPFCFFIAYGVFSIPAGMAVEKYKEKKVMIVAFFFSFIGAFLFSLFPSFSVALISLFLIGSGMAMLQVAINPLLRVAGGEENFAFNSVAGQLAFGLASFLSPHMYSYLVINLDNYEELTHTNFLLDLFHEIIPVGLSWVSLYWIFAVVSILMFVILSFIKFPIVNLKEDEKAGTWSTYRKLFKNKTVILFFIGLFAYVGTEQGVANWTSKFLEEYHGFEPRIEGANAVSLFWGLLTVGCFLGLVLLKFIDSRKILKIFTGAAIISLTVGLFGSDYMSLWAFPMVGFFASVMYSVIFSLALNSISHYHGAFSGILCTAIIGGAFVPLIIGKIGDLVGLRGGMFFLYVTLGYIFSIGFWAKPLVNNKMINIKETANRHKK